MAKYYDTKLHLNIHDIQEKHFWFTARSEMITSFVKKYMPIRTVPYLEVGFGTGILLPVFETMGFIVHGVDINDAALRLARTVSRATLIRSSFVSYRPSKRFSAIGTFDVLEHIPNHTAFLKHARTLLAPEGKLFLTVPACPMLYGKVDIESGHLRRYDKKSLTLLLEQCGFTVVSLRYWNTLLFPVYWVWKWVSEHGRKTSIEPFLRLPPAPLNQFLLWILRFDSLLMEHIPFPFGVTLVACAVPNALYNTGYEKERR